MRLAHAAAVFGLVVASYGLTWWIYWRANHPKRPTWPGPETM